MEMSRKQGATGVYHRRLIKGFDTSFTEITVRDMREATAHSLTHC